MQGERERQVGERGKKKKRISIYDGHRSNDSDNNKHTTLRLPKGRHGDDTRALHTTRSCLLSADWSPILFSAHTRYTGRKFYKAQVA